MEPGVQSPEETLAIRSGSCRDTGWLLVQLLRRLGLAARFVSGYLIQLRPDARLRGGPRGRGEDFADLHAWAEVYIPGAGWIGLDPTSGLLTAEGHIPLAATPSPASAAPITGTHGLAQVDFSVSMRVTRLHETPSVSAPYSDEQWQAILAAGAAVEERLTAGDVRLSMGGEPTFVAVGDGAAPEWNTAALGPTKRQLADKLARRLCARFASGGLLHYGQGKWYPGETTAGGRSASTGERTARPLARPGLIAEESAAPPSIADASCLRASCAARSDCRPAAPFPPMRMPRISCWRSRGCRRGDAARAIRLADPAERARLTRVFDRGLGKPVGYVLPLLMIDAGAPASAGSSPSAGPSGAGSCSWSQAIRPWACACRWRASPRSISWTIRMSLPADPFADPARSCPQPHAADPAATPEPCAMPQASDRPRPTRASPCGRRSPWRCATATCACSCRRSPTARTMPRSSPPSRRRPPGRGRPSAWRAIRHPSTPASAASR